MKKKGRKLIALLMCVLVGVMMFGVFSFAAGECDYTIRVTPTGTVNEGDMVTVAMDCNNMEVASFSGGFTFDTDHFEVTDIHDEVTKPDDDDDYFTALSSVAEANAIGNVGFAKTRTKTSTVSARALITVTLRAKESGPAKFAVFEDTDPGEGIPAKKIDAGGEGSPVIDIEVISDISLTPVEGKAATCTEAGYEAYWTDDEGNMFSDAKGKNKIDAPIEIPATGHVWGAPTYTWSDDNTTCTGSVICTACGEEANETSAVTSTTTAPSCTMPGFITYKADFTNELFRTQTKTGIGEPPLGHQWGEPTYTWAPDNSSVTAVHVCSVCQEEQKETVATSSVTTATCTEAGETTFTARFRDPAFREQTKTVDQPALGHDWQIMDSSVEWTGNDESGYTAATADFKCNRCGEIEKGVKAKEVKVDVAQNGDKYYTAFFEVGDQTIPSLPKIVKAPEKKADGGAAPAQPGVPTGDSNVIWLYIAGMVTAALLIAGCAIILRKKTAKNNK